MASLVNTIRELEITKLLQYLDENPSKKDILKELNNEKQKLTKKLSKLKMPVKKFGNIDRFLQTAKYKEYLKEEKAYELAKNEILNEISECENKMKIIDTDQEYDENRERVLNLIPLIEKARTIEEIAKFTFYGEQEIKSANKYLFAILLLFQSIDIIKSDSDINKVYNSLDLHILNQKLEDLNIEILIKNLKRIKIEIDDGFIQLISMIMNERSLCTQNNLMTAFPILKQLKEDNQVPKNIRVALEILDDEGNKKRTIHEVGCEILIKEIFYKIKEN